MVFKRVEVIVNCPACSGTGFFKFVSGKQLTCSVCKGTGKHKVVQKLRVARK